MPSPVYVFYRLSGFFQNHRRYYDSFSSEQLLGLPVSASELTSECYPQEPCPNGDQDCLDPCGIIFASRYNDVLAIMDSDAAEVPMSFDGLAWPEDIAARYAADWMADEEAAEPGYRQRTMAWMRVAGVPTFLKPYGVLDQPLLAGEYTLEVTDNFSLDGTGAEKSVVLATHGGVYTATGISAVSRLLYTASLIAFLCAGLVAAAGLSSSPPEHPSSPPASPLVAQAMSKRITGSTNA
jgi:hypothetical protein